MLTLQCECKACPTYWREKVSISEPRAWETSNLPPELDAHKGRWDVLSSIPILLAATTRP